MPYRGPNFLHSLKLGQSEIQFSVGYFKVNINQGGQIALLTHLYIKVSD